MRVEDLLRLWEQHHMLLTAEQRERFIARPAAARLCHYPDDLVEQVIAANPKLADALEAARREAGLRPEAQEPIPTPVTPDDDGLDEPQTRVERASPGIDDLVDLADPTKSPDEVRRYEDLHRRDTADEEVLLDADSYSFDVVEEEPDSSQEEEVERRINEYSERTGTYRCHTCQEWLPLEEFEYLRRGQAKVATNCEECRKRNRERHWRRRR